MGEGRMPTDDNHDKRILGNYLINEPMLIKN